MVLRAFHSAEYSASRVDREISICRKDFQMRGQPQSMIIKPVRDRTESMSQSGSRLYTLTKSASSSRSSVRSADRVGQITVLNSFIAGALHVASGAA
jgi:hypothetical protein